MSDAPVAIRAPAASEVPTLRGLLEREVGGTPYAAIPRYFLSLALERAERESSIVVAERGGEIVGLTLFGEVAGSVGTGRVHLIAVTASARLHGVAIQLCDAALAELAARGARLAIAEVPDDPVVASGRALLTRCGFLEEARVADYYRDGVAMVVLRREL
jgi:ribosomal protein S18 acetylase RimI-like enzyme